MNKEENKEILPDIQRRYLRSAHTDPFQTETGSDCTAGGGGGHE